MSKIVYNANYTPEQRAKNKTDRENLSNQQFIPIRGNEFKDYIHNILIQFARVPPNIAEKYVDEENIKVFEQAFTHETANSECNYEALEFVGDSILNLCVVEYLIRRFPEFLDKSGKNVSAIARLKINLVSTMMFSKFAKALEMDKYIASNNLVRIEKYDNILEDVFEAFQAAIRIVAANVNPTYVQDGMTVPIGPSFRIIAHFLDKEQISLKYEDLYDVNTRLKQLIEQYYSDECIGKCRVGYKTSQVQQPDGKFLFLSDVYLAKEGYYKVWGHFAAATKSAAEQAAAHTAIKNLGLAGYISNKS